MYKLANGWTKRKVMAQIKKFNNGSRAMDGINGGCSYKNNSGNRCAIGAFIPYKSGKALNFKGNIVELLVSFPKLKKYMPFDNINALMGLQDAHDNAQNGNVYASIVDFLKDEVE